MKNQIIRPEVMKSLCDDHRARKMSDYESQNQFSQLAPKQEAPQKTWWETIGNIVNLGCKILFAFGAFGCGVAKLKDAFSNTNQSVKYKDIGGRKRK
jgi:hypothetical protein